MKPMWNVCACVFALLLGLDRLAAQTVSPVKPRYGEKMLFRYDALARSAAVEPPGSITLVIYKNLSDAPETISMQKTDSIWTVQYTLSDTSAKMLFYAFRIQEDAGEISAEDTDGQLYDVLIYAPDGKPVRGAYETRALSQTGFSDKRGGNLQKALNDIEKELALYPNNLTARSLYYTLLLKQSGFSKAARTKIAENIRTVLASFPKDASVAQFAADSYRMIGETDQADRLEKEWIRKNPKGEQAARKAFAEILQIENARIRLGKLEQFRNDFPQTRMDEVALSQIVSSSIETEDVPRMVRAGDQLLQKAATPAGANALAALAGVFADKTIELDRAFSYIQKALSIMRSAATAPKPAELSEDAWAEQNRRTESRYRDVLGWVYFQKGNFGESQAELGKAAEHSFQANVFYHLGCLYAKTGNVLEALIHLGRAVAFGGKIAERAEGAFRELWNKTGKDTVSMQDFLDEQEQWVAEKNKELILSKRISRPAPDFKLEDASGGYVRLSAQFGNPLVLCFWASWSRSSLLALEDLQQLAQTFGKNVLFMTISTDAEKPGLQKLPNNDRLFLPVLIADGIEKAYAIQGVPVVYVVDRNGLIRFENKGYRPDLAQVLSIELEDVLGK